MTFERHGVYVVDFPYSDSDQIKRRPAVALCSGEFVDRTGNVLLAMITSAKQIFWPGDCEIDDLTSAGLKRPCKVRLRLLTLTAQRVGAPIGRLSGPDTARLESALRDTLLA